MRFSDRYIILFPLFSCVCLFERSHDADENKRRGKKSLKRRKKKEEKQKIAKTTLRLKKNAGRQ